MPQLRSRVPALLAWLVGMLALWQLLTVLFPAFRHLTRDLRHYLDNYYFWFPTANLAWVVALCLLGAALRARKRLAWVVLLVVVLAMVVNNVAFLVEGMWDAFGGLAFQLSVLAALLVGFPAFAAHVRAGAWWRAGAFWLVSLLVSFGIGFTLVQRFPGTLASTEDKVLWTLHQLLGGVGDTQGVIEGRGPFPLVLVLGFLGATVIIGTILIAFRSARLANTMTDADEELVRALITRYASADSLAYFATRRDKAVIFAADGHAAVTHRVEIGVCLASGDPVGDPTSWDDAIDAWRAHCRHYGLAPAVMGASVSGARAYSRHGLSVLRLGDEARLATDALSLRGPARAELRHAVDRARRAGLTARIRRQAELGLPEIVKLRRLAREWRDTEHERGFSMALGRFGEPADGDCLVVEAVRGEDEVVALLGFVPWGSSGVSLDLMRRSPDAPNGTVEFLVTELCRRADDLGLTRVSLNFAVFRNVFEQAAELGAGPFVRMWRTLLVFASRWWQLEALYRSNEKFGPLWEPRYLAYPDPGWIPRIGLAAAIAEGFVTMPLRPFERVHAPVQPKAPIAPGEVHAGRTPASPRRPDQVRMRLAKATALQRAGIDPWPVAEQPSHTIAEAAAAGHGTGVSIAGRVLALRDLGGVVFADVRDWSGAIQVVWDAARIGADGLAAVTRLLDGGDLVAVPGVRGVSRSGTESILGDGVRLEAKALHPLPYKRRGLVDPEARVRRRYLDLATGERSRELTRARSAILASLRMSLYARGYAEVETPILQPIHGGANARPFVTHINAYDLDLYLRIAPELYLKRLCVGGLDKVFELGRAFRNEGVDFSHNPEFTLLEAYAAHGDYHTMRVVVQELIQNAAQAVHGQRRVPSPDGGWVDISGDWPVVGVHDAVSRALEAVGGRPVTVDTGVEELRARCRLADVEARPGWDAGQIVLELYEHLVEGETAEPTFYCDFPVSVSPLVRSHRRVPGLAERWDLVAFGVELGTAYSELTDPVEQRRRLTEQSLKAADGDADAMEVDEDFLEALEFGMPPTGGLGVGVDRLVMLVTGASMRETLPFPLAKPRQRGEGR